MENTGYIQCTLRHFVSGRFRYIGTILGHFRQQVDTHEAPLPQKNSTGGNCISKPDCRQASFSNFHIFKFYSLYL
jgi:hypothetical protein